MRISSSEQGKITTLAAAHRGDRHGHQTSAIARCVVGSAVIHSAVPRSTRPSASTLHFYVIVIAGSLDVLILATLALHALVVSSPALTLVALTLITLASVVAALAAFVLSPTLVLLIPVLVGHRLLHGCCEQLVRGSKCRAAWRAGALRGFRHYR
jgi:hypothetical protein